MDKLQAATQDHTDQQSRCGHYCGIVIYYFSLWWFHMNRLLDILFLRVIAKPTPTRHNIVVLGDSVAEGFGGYHILGERPGMSRKLQRVLDLDPKLRHNWQVVNMGCFPACSADWLPDAASLPCASSFFWRVMHRLRTLHRPAPNLWRHMMGHDELVGANIVVIVLGKNDYRFNPKPEAIDQTVTNLLTLAQTLAKQGSKVFVCTIPLPKNARHPSFVVNTMRNELIMKAVKTYDNSEFEDGDGGIFMGLDLGHFYYRADYFFSRDGVHFSSEGYQKAATELKHCLQNSMVATEFAYAKARLTSQ